MNDQDKSKIQETLKRMRGCLQEIENILNWSGAPTAGQQEIGPVAHSGFGDILADEVAKAFPKGWPYGRDKGKPLHEVPESTLRWHLENRAPEKGSRFFEANRVQYDLVERALANIGTGATREPRPAKQATPPEDQEPEEDQIPF
jgi:hypothetical protein